MVDAVYTPKALAQLMVQSVSLDSPNLVADFAAGDGALLLAARVRWASVALFASDIRKAATTRLRTRIQGCSVATCDFIDQSIRSSVRKRLLNRCDLILLNPPFTCRGNSKRSVMFFGVPFTGSKALAFVAKALPYLAPGGEVVAILPASVLSSERDGPLLAAIRAKFLVTQVGDVQRSAFASHAVSVVLLKISHRAEASARVGNAKAKKAQSQEYKGIIRCGRLPVHEMKKKSVGVRFIHTTDLGESKIRRGASYVQPTVLAESGPVVLLPRVGKPIKGKIVLMKTGKAVLSDCVIGIRTLPKGHEAELAELLRKHWLKVEALYRGSCAPYATLNQVRELLSGLGVESVIVKRSGPLAKVFAGKIGEKQRASARTDNVVANYKRRSKTPIACGGRRQTASHARLAAQLSQWHTTQVTAPP